ncbi:Sua5/YciO/YrdC/YwlC family protein [Candidatus Tachikawaea gelatinosa]|uniref:Threonylcarbamoyl-AMP synthase n=1 Tax=Candidatus Tachikawaea gelatinosa TaxID=1410383 RepID=A0A090ALK7_9ENTR|nr:Sua5/YciO/YrdC/YwlC family protein [Candidatus Tachikawaea gelatinosa]BAP58529.1 tRNA threonylcarbamoyladenosine biosynthesis protein RimN [Candidatus Tachikawaea gelatinosa]
MCKNTPKKKIIAYPTEAIFSLGCDPNSKDAVMSLLSIKKRSINKGFILIADSYMKLVPYINQKKISLFQYKKIILSSVNFITYVVPAALNVPYWITGNFHTLAIRLSQHPDVKKICKSFGKAIISTSANISGQKPCRSVKEVKKKFGKKFPILIGHVGNRKLPSEIRDLMTNKIIRKG